MTPREVIWTIYAVVLIAICLAGLFGVAYNGTL